MIQRARATTRANQRGMGSAWCRILVSALARKFWMITSWIAPVLAARSRRAKRESTISRIDLPDPDQDPCGERHLLPAGGFDRRHPGCRVLGDSALMGHACFGEPGRDVLQHHPHRRVGRSEQAERGIVEQTGIGMREETGLGPDQLRHLRHVLQRGVVTSGGEELPGLGPPLLGTVTQREQGLGARRGITGSGDSQDFVGLEIDPSGTGWLGEGAVAAAIDTECRERDEDLAAVGDDPSLALVSQSGGMRESGPSSTDPRR